MQIGQKDMCVSYSHLGNFKFKNLQTIYILLASVGIGLSEWCCPRQKSKVLQERGSCELFRCYVGVDEGEDWEEAIKTGSHVVTGDFYRVMRFDI